MNLSFLFYFSKPRFVLPWCGGGAFGSLARRVSRTRQCAAAIVLAMLLAGAPSALASAPAASAEAAEMPSACVPGGFMVLAVNEDSVTSGIQWGERTYREISSGLLFRSFVEQIDEREVFDSIGRRPDRPYDYILNFRIERLRRRPVSSPDDMWLEVSLDLREQQQRRSIWAERFAIPVESRELGPRREPDGLFFRLLTHLAARKLAAAAVAELAGLLASSNPEKLNEASPQSCPARSVIWLGLKGLPLEDERAVLRALSRSSCYELEWASEDSVASSDAGSMLLEAWADPSELIHLRLWLPEAGFKDYRPAWQVGDATTRDAVLQDAKGDIAAYHHRIGACGHATPQ